jgi:signal transduction histidine kinase
VLADRQQIVEALLELIRNAVQAAGETASIRLSARDDPMHAGVQLCVSDFGTGMDPQTLAGAFTPFFSAQQAGRRRGLGLPRAKRYVENNRGRIWIRSRRKVGTTVHVLLPYSEADDEAAENEHANDRQENRPHPGRR